MSTRWAMPGWTEPYRELIQDTGGNAIEDLMNRPAAETTVQINAPVALICVAVRAQLGLLARLRKARFLVENAGEG